MLQFMDFPLESYGMQISQEFVAIIVIHLFHFDKSLLIPNQRLLHKRWRYADAKLLQSYLTEHEYLCQIGIIFMTIFLVFSFVSRFTTAWIYLKIN